MGNEVIRKKGCVPSKVSPINIIFVAIVWAGLASVCLINLSLLKLKNSQLMEYKKCQNRAKKLHGKCPEKSAERVLREVLRECYKSAERVL